jgi:hypothetical protein
LRLELSHSFEAWLGSSLIRLGSARPMRSFSSEACEHVFGIARQIHADFDFAGILQMVPKIFHYFKSIRTDDILIEKEKSVREGIFFIILIFLIYY